MVAEEGLKKSTMPIRLSAAQYILLLQAFTWSATISLLTSGKPGAVEEVKSILYRIAGKIDG
ncbi:MAG: hypothetical protein LIQ31_11015 [Planctomycetes bacterium]|nr:hypothetical protein [Planctomycetota bacterium]